MATKKIGSAGRFGVRYGARLRNKIALVEKKQKNWQTCPYCLAPRVKRISLGIWKCRKCNTKFAGRAYEI